MDRLHEEWLHHPETARHKDRLLRRLQEVETALLNQCGPGHDEQLRLMAYGQRGLLRELIEAEWGAELP
jgi:hypothetical protein